LLFNLAMPGAPTGAPIYQLCNRFAASRAMAHDTRRLDISTSISTVLSPSQSAYAFAVDMIIGLQYYQPFNLKHTPNLHRAHHGLLFSTTLLLDIFSGNSRTLIQLWLSVCLRTLYSFNVPDKPEGKVVLRRAIAIDEPFNIIGYPYKKNLFILLLTNGV